MDLDPTLTKPRERVQRRTTTVRDRPGPSATAGGGIMDGVMIIRTFRCSPARRDTHLAA